MGFKGRKQSKLIRCMKGTIKILARARDSYFQNMSSSGAHVFYGSAMSCPTPQVGSLPRNIGIISSSNSSYSTSSDEYFKRSSPMRTRGVAASVRRSQLDPIGRIDEGKCFEFVADHVLEMAYPKNIRCAATRRSMIASVDYDSIKNAKYGRI